MSFYTEAGGQEYDTGNIIINGATDFELTNVQSYIGYILHTGSIKYGQLSVGDEVISYNELHHWPLHSNHTAMHRGMYRISSYLYLLFLIHVFI
ncbi:hypothetical protein EDB19DRAFT_1908718 [Suillus lakei]|nr:hypothetical protein EDB19DRAFT_1908718 [Suillus lakei]